MRASNMMQCQLHNKVCYEYLHGGVTLLTFPCPIFHVVPTVSAFDIIVAACAFHSFGACPMIHGRGIFRTQTQAGTGRLGRSIFVCSALGVDGEESGIWQESGKGGSPITFTGGTWDTRNPQTFGRCIMASCVWCVRICSLPLLLLLCPFSAFFSRFVVCSVFVLCVSVEVWVLSCLRLLLLSEHG